VNEAFKNINRNLVIREVIIQQLKKLPLFSKVSVKELEEVASIAIVKKYRKGEIIFLESDNYSGFYCVIEGIVKVYRTTSEGKERIIHLLYNNDTFGEVPVFENYGKIITEQAKYPANAMNLCEGSRIFLIPAKPFYELMKVHHGLCIGMLSGLSKKLRMMQGQIMNVKSNDVTKRLVNYLLSEYFSRNSISLLTENEKIIDTFNLSISKIDLSSYLGATLETISRTFKKLQSENYIDLKGKSITIKNVNGLKKLLVKH